MKKLINIVLYRVFGRVPKNGQLREYIQRLNKERLEERERRALIKQMMEAPNKQDY